MVHIRDGKLKHKVVKVYIVTLVMVIDLSKDLSSRVIYKTVVL